MRAWFLDESPGTYRWGEVPDPVVGPGEVKVRVRATALNHMDLWLTTGLPKPPAFPHVPGNDVAGVIDEVGSAVTDWAPGDEVVINTALVPEEALVRGDDSVLDPAMTLLGEGCWGGHGEFCVVAAHQLARRPTGRSWAEAASYPVCYTTAWRLFRRAGIQKGDTVLVTGIGGGVATAALMLAQHVGARVFVTSRDAAKRDRALELGAEGAFPSDEPYPVTADIVVDSIGPATWDFAFRTLRHGGRMCVCGGTSGPKVELNLPRLFFKQIDVIGASCGSQTEFQHVTDLLSDGLPVVVDEILPLSEYPRALERLRSAEQLGKIVLEHPEP
ncbi:zinc-binding dehydrogenase [Dermatobacter hominis]|uniref:zinc-binding dehydrogenase n=1 Tax=Dermatobacter hominis TaxID=2884263 RepID=UPI001D1188D3|nr:zinc-binding dehydrogenase [Dermatobacter hominis]UDY36379.1 zinc-binding dehydrogenase [Dermatobacter hominis]